MRFEGDTLDDILREIYPPLLEATSEIEASRGKNTELIGVQIVLMSPRARLSRTETRGKPFSCLGELIWYLSGEDRLDFIQNYIPAYRDESDDGVTIRGAYGPRLFKQRGHNQIENVVELLMRRPTSRKAVIQLFNAEDLNGTFSDIPCTTTLQFLVRDGKLDMITTMRSNDSYKGLPHDVFCFTMLMEIVARSIGVEIGTYHHFVGSLHLYENDRADAQACLDEKFQRRIEMQPMPIGDPTAAIAGLIHAERLIRQGDALDADQLGLDAYWTDLVRLLQVFAATGEPEKIAALKSKMAFRRYAPYIDSRVMMKPRPKYRPIQFELPLQRS